MDVPGDLTLTAPLTDQPWHFSAACRDSATDLFFAEPGGRRDEPGSQLTTYGRPARVCARCPVRRECLTDALESEDGFEVMGHRRRLNPAGVWGGTSPKMRHDPRIRHLDDCKTKKCKPPCRPLGEVLDMLEAWHRREVAPYLLPSEEIAD